MVTIGMDLGDRSSRYCLLDEEGVVIGEASTPTTKAAIAKVFGAMARCRIALEAGGHSPWVSRQLEEFGHEVIVANPRNVRLIGESTRKDDRLDRPACGRNLGLCPTQTEPSRTLCAEEVYYIPRGLLDNEDAGRSLGMALGQTAVIVRENGWARYIVFLLY